MFGGSYGNGHGLNSPYFALAAAFAIVVMFDARVCVGQLAGRPES